MEDSEKREIGSSTEELPFWSDGACTPASVAGGLAATLVREGSLVEAPVQLAGRQPKFPSWPVGSEPRMMRLASDPGSGLCLASVAGPTGGSPPHARVKNNISAS